MTLHTAADRLTFLQQNGIRDVECIFADISGYPRGKLMPAGMPGLPPGMKLPF